MHTTSFLVTGAAGGIERNRSQLTFPLVNRVLVGAYRRFPRLTTRAIIASQRGH